MKIISGGQTGADKAALVVAKRLGLETGGTAPRGYRTEDGPDLSLKEEFGLVEGPDSGYVTRTILNIRNSDGTVIFAKMPLSGGSLLTYDKTTTYCKPVRLNPTAEELRAFIKRHDIQTLNVAGNRRSQNPTIAQHVEDVLTETFKDATPNETL